MTSSRLIERQTIDREDIEKIVSKQSSAKLPQLTITGNVFLTTRRKVTRQSSADMLRIPKNWLRNLTDANFNIRVDLTLIMTENRGVILLVEGVPFEDPALARGG